MIGFFYLVLCFTTGAAICSLAFPGLVNSAKTDYNKAAISFCPYLLLLPAWYLVGTLALTWGTYLTAMAFARAKEPLFWANLMILPIAGIVSAVYLWYKKAGKGRLNTVSDVSLKQRKTLSKTEQCLLVSITVLAFLLMWATFFVKGNKLYIGLSVFSDFSPHIGMIRSFSYGNNFPTSYSHYAGEDIKYHFMFQFMVANLEYLGLRLDYAFNLPSMLSFISAFLLLYLLALKITGRVGAGCLACLFFSFRSSKTLFTYLAKLPPGTGIIQALTENTAFLSDTPKEDWGLWNLNVYCNQRHLAFGLAVMFLVILLLLPRVYEMHAAIGLQRSSVPEASEDGATKNTSSALTLSIGRVKRAFFTKEAWSIADYRTPIAAGILLGSLSFFHGAAVIGCLLVLFAAALLAEHRLEFALLAAITIGMAYLQTNFFMEGSAVGFDFLFGFIAENGTLFGAASYLERLLGILPFVLFADFCIQRSAGRHLMLAFTLPLIFAFTVSMTVDVTVNHKYVMMSCILLGIFAADLVLRLFKRRDTLASLAGVILTLMLSLTGIYDFITVMKKNIPSSAIVLDLDDPLTQWINENSNSQDIFLTSNYAINQVVLGGAMLYQGWQYYAWSAGYDTSYRDEQVRQMYEADTPQELDALVHENHIRFIIVDRDNRNSKDYQLKEENIRSAYQRVYQEGEGERELSIYDTHLPLFTK
jgi:hypothetical protein